MPNLSHFTEDGKTAVQGLVHEDVLLNIKPASGAAKVEIIGASLTSTDGNTTISTADGDVGTYHAVNLFQQNQVQFTVTAADGVTEQLYTINIIRANSDCAVSAFVPIGGTLTPDFAPNTLRYALQFTVAAVPVTVTPAIPDDATIKLNGESVEFDAVLSLSATNAQNVITVTAADNYTTKEYVFTTILPDGSIPLAGISDATKAKAKQILKDKGWYEELSKTNDFSSGYWKLFMAAATGLEDGSAVNLNGAAVYDITKHNFRQATDWAACTLELIILGENPYDYNGVNYVQGLIDCGGGPFANNVWYLIAANAAGVKNAMVDSLVTSGVKNVLSTTYDLDTRGWYLAALSANLDPAELAALANVLHDAQITEGRYASTFKNGAMANSAAGNPYSNGCVVSGLAGANIDLQTVFAVGDKTPLDVMATEFKFDTSYKDMIIGLGDITQGSSIFARYALTSAKYESLKTKATALGIDTASLPAFGAGEFGREYYDLYDAVVAAYETAGNTVEARKMRPDVQFGNQLQIFETAVNALPATVTSANKTAVEAARDVFETKLTEVQKTALLTNSKAVYNKYLAALAAIVGEDGGTDAKAAFEKIAALPKPSELVKADRTAVDAAKSAYDALGDSAKSAINWAGAGYAAKLADAVAIIAQIAPDTGTGGGGQNVDSVTVTFRLVGDSVHDTPDKHTKYADWIPTKSYTFYNATSVSV
ncbi:MAG: cadherin-like beta sandwich domain-containing protein, partial [Oscillospiraceae bacterium]|nr:cadherin-like beta sandwich domain-containing protein [Oscillospiraceae bacterium]